MERTFVIVAVATSMVAGVASADPVGVTCNVSGSSGNYVLDFSVTNNLNPADMGVYFFGVKLDTGRDIVGSPAPFDPDTWTNWDMTPYGGAVNGYNNNWIEFSFVQILPGQTLSGFQARYTGASLPASVPFFAFAYSPSGGAYTGQHLNNPQNPGFEGHVAIPAPASLALAGLGGLALRRRR